MPERHKPHIPDDRHPEDGFLLGGWRKIRKGGKIHFNHTVWINEKLDKWAGMYIYVETDDWLCRNLFAKPKGSARGPRIQCVSEDQRANLFQDLD